MNVVELAVDALDAYVNELPYLYHLAELVLYTE